MPGIERVDSMYNIPALTTESAQLEKLLQKDSDAIVELYGNIEKFQGKSNVSSITKNWQDVTTSMTGAATASDALIEIQQKLNDQITRTAALEKQLADAQAKGNTVRKTRKDMSDAELKASLDANEATKNRIKSLQAEADAYKALELAAANATKTAKTLQATAISTGSPTDAQAAAKASAAAKQLNDQLKQISHLGGQDQLNVGNYKEALFQLEQELASVRNSVGKMAGLGDSVGSEMDTAKLHAKALADQIIDLKAKIAQLSGGAKITIGNDQAFTTLSTELANVKEQMSALAVAGMEDSDTYSTLETQAKALTLILSQQENGFKSVTMQIRASERALATLAAVGLEGSDAFKELQTSTNAAARAQQELQRHEKLLESEAPILGAITLAARGLAGAYAIGAGATSLFADGNEKVEKELNKLIAIMTILQGLTETYEFLNKSGASAAVIRTALMKAGTIAAGENAAAIEAVNAANAKSVLASEAAAAASGEEAVALEAEAAAAAEAAEATTAAAASAAKLDAALAGTAIGLAIIAAAVAIGYLISKMKEWNAETDLTVEEQKALFDSMAEYQQILQQINNLQDSAPKNRDDLADLEKQLSLEEKSGVNQYRIFALKQKIAEKNKEISDSELANTVAAAENKYVSQGLIGIDALKQAQKDYFDDWQTALGNVAEEEKNMQKYAGMSDQERAKGHNARDADEAKSRLERAKSAAAAAKVTYDASYDSEKKAYDNDKAVEENRTELAKFQSDERRRIYIEAQKLQIEGVKTTNAIILADDRATLAERINAIESNAQQSNREAQLNRLAVTGNPSSTPAEIKEAYAAEKQANDDADKKRAEDLRKARYADYIKRVDALADITAAEMQIQQTAAQKILDDEKSTYGQRLKAMYDFYDAQRITLGSEMGKQLANESLTKEQRLAIIKNYDAKIAEQESQIDKQRDKERDDERAKELKAIEAFYAKSESITAQEQAKAHVGLLQDLMSGKISPGTYDIRKSQADYKANLSDAQDRVNQAEIGITSTQDGTPARAAADEEMAKSQMALANTIADHKKSLIEDTNKLEKDAAEETQKMLISFADDAYENEIRHIEHQIALNKRYETAQLNRIKNTTIGESQKAAAEAVITEQAARNQQVLERREMEVKRRQAKFDRDVAVAQTIEQGAIAAISALKLEPPFGEIEAVAIGVITAAKVAEILAQPLPAYGFGTDDHPGGLALLGDRFAREGVLEPGRAPYLSPAVPTIMDLAPHTKVIPLDDIARMRDNNMYVNAQGVLMMQGDTGMRKVADAINRQTDRLESALTKQRKTVVNRVSVDTNWGHYVQKNVFNWKA